LEHVSGTSIGRHEFGAKTVRKLSGRHRSILEGCCRTDRKEIMHLAGPRDDVSGCVDVTYPPVRDGKGFDREEQISVRFALPFRVEK
jgi:hypothetical protein